MTGQRKDNWTPVAEALPVEKVEVEVITPGGDKRTLVYDHHLWWVPDMSMYVYFTPTCWRPLAAAAAVKPTPRAKATGAGR